VDDEHTEQMQQLLLVQILQHENIVQKEIQKHQITEQQVLMCQQIDQMTHHVMK